MKCIGIDLGTTNSVAAIRGATATVVQSAEADDHTPSVVSWHKGEMVVGKWAVNNFKYAPLDTIISIKRLMGRAFRDREVQSVKGNYLYKIAPPSSGDEDGVCVHVAGKEYTPVQISSMILKKIREDAQLRLNTEVGYAVITVPAYFTERQKEATRRAATEAGLKVQRVLDEPTAAAIAFGIDAVEQGDAARNVLVYDLGGGTFDVSVLTCCGGMFAQLSIEGNMWLGGDNFDHALMERVLDHVRAVHGVDGRTNPVFMAELRLAAEQAKKLLSSSEMADIFLPGALKQADGTLVDVEYEISRADFEALLTPAIDKSIATVLRALDVAHLSADDIDDVLLVGGSSMIPLVRQKLAAVFRHEKLRSNIDPMKCVAFGAAILSARMGPSWSCSSNHANEPGADVCHSCSEPRLSPTTAGEGKAIEVEVGVLTALPYGIRKIGDQFAVVIPKGSPYPTQEPVVARFHTPEANMRRLRVATFCGESQVASENEPQATIWIDLPPGIPEDTPVDVGFSLDRDGILSRVDVEILHGAGIREIAFVGRPDSRRNQAEKRLASSHEEIKTRILTHAQEADCDRIYSEAAQALNRGDTELAEAKLVQIETMLQSAGEQEWVLLARGTANMAEIAALDYDWAIDRNDVAALKVLIQEVRSAVSANDRAAGERKTDELRKATDRLPEVVRVQLLITLAAMRATNRGDELTAEKIRNAKNQIDAALKRGDVDGAVRLLQAHEALVKQVMAESGVRAVDVK